MDVLGGHLVHEREVRHDDVHHRDRDVHARRPGIRLDPQFGGQGERFEALPVGQRAERRRGGQQIVQMRGARARQSRDDHWWQ